MRKPLSSRPLTPDEPPTLQEGLRSSPAFGFRRWQLLLARARGQTARVLAESLSGDAPTVRPVLHPFNTQGLACLRRRAAAPPRPPHAACDAPRREP